MYINIIMQPFYIYLLCFLKYYSKISYLSDLHLPCLWYNNHLKLLSSVVKFHNCNDDSTILIKNRNQFTGKVICSSTIDYGMKSSLKIIMNLMLMIHFPYIWKLLYYEISSLNIWETPPLHDLLEWWGMDDPWLTNIQDFLVCRIFR